MMVFHVARTVSQSNANTCVLQFINNSCDAHHKASANGVAQAFGSFGHHPPCTH